jgi:hypothetical protein
MHGAHQLVGDVQVDLFGVMSLVGLHDSTEESSSRKTHRRSDARPRDRIGCRRENLTTRNQPEMAKKERATETGTRVA